MLFLEKTHRLLMWSFRATGYLQLKPNHVNAIQEGLALCECIYIYFKYGMLVGWLNNKEQKPNRHVKEVMRNEKRFVTVASFVK